jgi:uncharacterized protein
VSLPRPHLFGMLAGLFLAVGLVLSAMLLATTWLKVKNSQFISVKGSARKNIESDLVVWRGGFTVEAASLLAAQDGLKAQADKVGRFLAAAGVTNYTFKPVEIDELSATVTVRDDDHGAHETTMQKIVGYRLAQSVEVESADLDRVTRLDTTPLLADGVQFTNAPLQFLYTRVAGEKIEMLAEATKDARVRAEQIAAQGGRRIARLHSAEMGVFQITPQHGVETSWQGENDTTAREKTITAVVSASFLLR